MRSAMWVLGMGLMLVSAWVWPNSLCERPISVAVSPLGETMKINGQQVSGIIPELLSKVEQETGCKFKYLILPRVRALRMFEQGEIDLIVAAQISQRDLAGVMTPILSVKSSLISRKSRLTNVDPLLLLQQGKLLVNVVRGMNSGPEYLALLAELKQKNKLEEVVDLDVIAHKMALNRADAIIIPPMVFLEAATVHGIADDLQITQLVDIPASRSGIYLSTQLLAKPAGQRVQMALNKIIRSGWVWRMYQQRLPAWSLIGITPITPAL